MPGSSSWMLYAPQGVKGSDDDDDDDLTSNSAGLRTVLPNRLSHRELRSSLRESHSFLSLPAETTLDSSQGTSASSNSFSR